MVLFKLIKMTDINNSPSNIENDKKAKLEKLIELFYSDQGDAKYLQTVSDEEIKEFTDFLLAATIYYKKIEKWEVVPAEERELYGNFIENNNRINNQNNRLTFNIGMQVEKLRNIKDIAYHKYLWMTRWKMPGYVYKFDRQKDINVFNDQKRKTLIWKSEIKMGYIYINSGLDRSLNMEDDSSNRNAFYKNIDSYNWFSYYIGQAKSSIKIFLDNKNTRHIKDIKELLLEFRYMLEVADATHNVTNKKILSDMIAFCESAVSTMQNNEFEIREQKRKEEIETEAVIKYCEKNNIRLDDIIAMKQYIDKINKENEEKAKSLTEITTKMEEDEKNNKKIINEYEKFLKDIIAQSKETTFGGNYKIPKEFVDKIKIHE